MRRDFVNIGKVFVKFIACFHRKDAHSLSTTSKSQQSTEPHLAEAPSEFQHIILSFLKKSGHPTAGVSVLPHFAAKITQRVREQIMYRKALIACDNLWDVVLGQANFHARHNYWTGLESITSADRSFEEALEGVKAALVHDNVQKVKFVQMLRGLGEIKAELDAQFSESRSDHDTLSTVESSRSSRSEEGRLDGDRLNSRDPRAKKVYYKVTVECDLSEVFKIQEVLNKNSKAKIVALDIILKAAAAACKKVDSSTSVWTEKGVSSCEDVNICVAMEGPNGIFMPLITGVNKKGIGLIAAQRSSIVEEFLKTRNDISESVNCTFAISIVGKVGRRALVSSLIPEIACILEFDPKGSNTLLQGSPKVKSLTAKLSCNNKIVNGTAAAEWIKEFKTFFKNPHLILL